MPHWISEWILAIVDSVPVLFEAAKHNATLIRAMAALFLVLLIMCAMPPVRSFIARCLKMGSRTPDK